MSAKPARRYIECHDCDGRYSSLAAYKLHDCKSEIDTGESFNL